MRCREKLSNLFQLDSVYFYFSFPNVCFLEKRKSSPAKYSLVLSNLQAIDFKSLLGPLFPHFIFNRCEKKVHKVYLLQSLS